MTEFLLQTDPLEFQNSRQSTKIIFLQQELLQTQDYARDLEQIVKINKEALRIATNQQPKQTTKRKNPTTIETASTFDINSNREYFQNLQLLVEQLQEENSKFLEIIEKAKKERNIAQSKALISEQICEEAQRHEAETVHELEEKIADLRKLLQDKEYAIQELEKMKAIPEQEGVVVKYREVLNPSEQNMKFHNEINALNGMLAKLSKELNKIQTEKQELMTINFSLTNELAKLRATLASPLNFPPKFGRRGSGDLNNSVGQAAIFFQPPIEFLDENSPYPSPLPSATQVTEHQPSKAPVPKLDLSKAKQIQEQYAKKLTQPQQQNYGGYNADAMDKVKQLEDELEITRKRLSHEMINNRLVSEELAKLHKQIRQLTITNEVLIKSNKRYEEKWQKIFYTLEFYKEYYHKYIDLITRGHSGGHIKSASMSTPKFESFQRNKGKMFAEIDADPTKMIKDFKRINEENGKYVQGSIFEANEEEGSEKQLPQKEEANNPLELTKEQCKIYLLRLAKEIYVTSNLKKYTPPQKMPQNDVSPLNEPLVRPLYKIKRSMSNPLEYISEKKRLLIEPGLKRKNLNNPKKKKISNIITDQNDILLANLDHSEIGAVGSGNKLETEGPNNEIVKTKPDGADEMISFSVDPDEFNKNKMVEVSFISNNDILDHLKNN